MRHIDIIELIATKKRENDTAGATVLALAYRTLVEASLDYRVYTDPDLPQEVCDLTFWMHDLGKNFWTADALPSIVLLLEAQDTAASNRALARISRMLLALAPSALTSDLRFAHVIHHLASGYARKLQTTGDLAEDAQLATALAEIYVATVKSE